MAAVDEAAAEWFTEARFLLLLFSNLGKEPPLNISCFRNASTDASVQEEPPLNLSAFSLCDRPRDDVFSVARAGGPGRLSCVAGRRGPVHGVPHNRLGDSEGPGTAKCSSREVLRADGGLNFVWQGLPGLFVD